MYKTTIKIPIFEFNLTIIIDEEIEKIVPRYLKKYGMEPLAEGGYYGLSLDTPDHKYFIFYQLHGLTPNCIVHEVSHIVDYIIEKTEVEKLGETRAYITGYIVEKIFDYVLKNKILISKYLDFAQKPALVAEGSKAPVCKTVQPLVQIQPSAQNQIDGSKES